MVALPYLNTTQQALSEHGYALVEAETLTPAWEYPEGWTELAAAYPHLPADEYLPGGARYRFRRYDRFHFDPISGALDLLPHQDYFQSTDINAVTGGIVRKFAPLTPELAANPFMHAMIRWNFAQFPLVDPRWSSGLWQVDAHMIYVVAQPGEHGHPTPEGVHRDGAEFVTVHLAALDNADGGLVTVYDDDKHPLASFQLDHLLHSYLFEDARLWHGVKPITPRDPRQAARRGILTFDYHFLGS